ncbi:MAG TPA: ABC transporter permease [Terriglobia bacterium]|nr:ABC transporter permease [Terriglobia bacterium]
MTRIAAIAVHTFKESVREKVLYNLVAFALLMIGAGIVLGSVSVGINEIALINLGLSAISVFGLLIAIFIGISLVWKEIERRTVYNVLSKPVARHEFILGKYLGLVLTLAVNAAIMTAGFYAALFYEQRRFGPADAAPLEAVYFILLQLALLVGVALLFSTLSTPVLSAVFTVGIFVIGNLLGDLRGFGDQAGNAALRALLHGLAWALPDFGAFNAISQAAHGELISRQVLWSNSLYALFYISALVSAAILVFERREFS